MLKKCATCWEGLIECNFLMRAIYKDCYWFLPSALIFLSIFLHRIHCCVCQLVLLNKLYDDDNDGCGGDDDDDNDDGDDVV